MLSADKNTDKKNIELFEFKCHHRLLHISWTEKITNEWILEKMDANERQLAAINRRKMNMQ